jgi:L-alanine-DL-glutamate epimerase-like enolase superfamily enzyme
MERRKFMKSLGVAMPAAALPIGGMFAQTVPRYRPVKITKVSSTAYSMPIPASGYSSSERAGTKKEWGRALRVTPHRPDRVLEYIVVKIESDSGHTGYGEATPDIGFFGATLEADKSSIDLYFGPKLVGRDPFDREEILRQLDYRGNSCPRSAIDLALHDLMGKILGLPVYDLIGGLCADRIPVEVEIGGGPPREMAEACLKWIRQGVRAFKPKVGGYPEEDAERLRAIREAVGRDIVLRADANRGFSVKEAIRFCRLLETYDVGLEYLEQPVDAPDLKGMAEVRRSVETQIVADESSFTVQDAMNVIREGAADRINIKIEKAGGLYNAKKIAALAEAAGLDCVIGTAFGLGLTMAAKLHLAASTAIVRGSVEFTEATLHENLLAAPHDKLLAFPLKDGCFPVPQGPGFGVAFDEARAKAFVSKIV